MISDKEKLKLYNAQCKDCGRTTIHMVVKDLIPFDPVTGNVHEVEKVVYSTVCTKCIRKGVATEEEFKSKFIPIHGRSTQKINYANMNIELTQLVNSFMLPSELNFVFGLVQIMVSNNSWVFMVPSAKGVSKIAIDKKFSDDNVYPCYSSCPTDELYMDDIKMLLGCIVDAADVKTKGYIKFILLAKEMDNGLVDHIANVKYELQKYNSYYGGRNAIKRMKNGI
ncbi:MAG: hypothetical protein D4S01_08785 [Dehalococcoidia bacterium]|nr:MAG: hypothetical protein D4S01_08785 [Dehalococcoidia bacterium]